MRYVQAGVMLLGAGIEIVFVTVALQLSLTLAEHGLIILASVAGWNALLAVVTVLVIVDSVRKIRAGRSRELATDVFVVKLASIPFFVITFVLLVYMAFGGLLLFIFGGVLLHIAAAIAFGLTYLALASTSIYGLASIVQLRRERRIDRVLVVPYSLMLFVFLADTVAGILLFAHSRRRRPVELGAAEESAESVELDGEDGNRGSLRGVGATSSL